MAITKTVNYKGIKISDAYHRVWGVSLIKDSISFGLGVHASRDGEMVLSSHYTCEYSMDQVNPIAQSYNHVKSLPDFSDA